MSFFDSKPKISVQECCRQFYDKGIFHSIVAGTDVWSIMLDTDFKSIAEADQSFLSVDRTLFRNEMTALRMEMFAFALGCSKKFGIEKYTVPLSIFTRQYLEENGRLDIWDIMAEYNLAISRSAVMDANLKQYPEARVTLVNDLRMRNCFKWIDNINANRTVPIEKNDPILKCVARVANRSGADTEREDDVAVKSMAIKLAYRLGCDPNLKSEALFKLFAIIFGFYQGTEEYLKSVDLQG